MFLLDHGAYSGYIWDILANGVYKMQTITTKYIGPTEKRCSRIKVTHSGNYASIIMSYDHALNAEENYVVAAKSGTVELVSTETKEDYKLVRKNIGNRDHAIIVAFGPMPNPRYAVSVVIENGESGGSVAGPVAIAVLNELITE